MNVCPICEKTYGDHVSVCPADGATLRTSGPPPDPFLGQTINGRYAVIRKLGEGGMGAVYLAEQVSMSRKVALKILHGHFARDEEFVRRFRLEARLAAALNHRNVITVHDFDQAEDGSLFIAMEYLEGRTLSEVIRQDGALAVGRAVRFGMQIAQGLEAAHRAGVIHRDIKPHNIMAVGRGDDLKLMDFGIARLMDAEGSGLTRTGMVMGTPAYMAPEQIEGGEITEQTDIYAFGIVLYELLTGRVPFTASSPRAVLTKHLQEAPVPLRTVRPEVPASVERVVMQALEKQPQARQRDMGEVLGGLQGAGGQPTEDVGDIVAGLPTGRSQSQQGQFAQTMAASATVASPRRPAGTRWKLIGAGVGLAVLAVSVALFLALGGLDRLWPSKPARTATVTPPPPVAPPKTEDLPPAVEPLQAPAPPAPVARPQPPPLARPPAPQPVSRLRPPGPSTGPSAGRPDVVHIRRQIEQALRTKGFLKEGGPRATGVTVDIDSAGIVTLTGVLRDREQRGETVRLASGIPGVTEVRDRINVQGSWQDQTD